MQCEQLGPDRCAAEAIVVIDTLYSMIPSCSQHAGPYEDRHGTLRNWNGNRIIPMDTLTPAEEQRALAQNAERRRIMSEIEEATRRQMVERDLTEWRKQYIGVVS